jgi:hypothetical protein
MYASPGIIKATKSMGIRWAGHVAHVGEMRNTVFCFENLKGRAL